MAEFNPFVPQPNIPDWTNAPGRLIDGSGLGEIFGKVAMSVSEQYGKAKEGKATTDLYQSADAAAEEGRVGALADAAGIPRDVAKAMDKAKLYKQAFESGKFTEAGFYSKMDVWSKEMRVRYPQYQEIIDQQLTRVMGRTPANLEMDSVRQQYADQQSASQTSQDKDFRFLEDNVGELSDNEVILYRNAAPGSEIRERLKIKALLSKQAKAEEEASIKQLERNSKAGAIEAAPVLALQTSNILRGLMNETVSSGGGTFANFNAMIKKFSEDGFDQNEIAELTTIADHIIDTANKEWMRITTSPDESGRSMAEYFANDIEKMNAQRKRIDDFITSVKEAKEGKTGFLMWNAVEAEASMDARVRQLQSVLGKDTAEGFAAMRKVLGAEVTDTLLMKSLQDNESLQSMVTNMVKGISYKDGNPFAAIQKVKDNADKSLLPEVNKAARAVIEDKINLATDSSLPIETRREELTQLLSDKDHTFFRSLKDMPDNTGMSSREKFYKYKMQDPKLAAAAKELGLEKEYTARLKSYGVALAETNIAEANATNVNTELADISFNPETMRWEMRLNKSKVTPVQERQIAGWLTAKRTRNGSRAWSEIPANIGMSDLDALGNGADAVQKLNMIVEGLVLAFKTETPGISNEQIGKQITEYLSGLKTSYTKVGPWWDRAYEAVKNIDWLGSEAQKQWQKETYGDDFGAIPDSDGNFNVQEGSAVSRVGTAPNTGDDTANTILAFIHGAEGADYNTVFGGGKVDAAGMTVADVIARTENAGSSAFGAVQVMKDTLRDLVNRGVVTPDQVMNQATQDKIGMALMKQVGYDDWKSGKLTDNEFADRLAGIWASLPLKGGKSKYDGVGKNKTTVSRGQVLSMLEDLR